MKISRENIDISSALKTEEICKYKYVILNRMSSLDLVSVEDLQTNRDIDPTELLEARFFSEDAELHIFRDNDDELKAIRISETDTGDDYEMNEVRYMIRGGGVFVVREYLKGDEDGQMCVALTRAAGVE